MFTLHPQLARDCMFIEDLPLCRLLLMNDRNYPWCILVPRRDDLRELHDLDETDRQQFMRESCRLSRVMSEVFVAYKMNVAALGNIVPQLHVHHIVRQANDPAWPGPVWGVVPAVPYTAALQQDVIDKIKNALSIGPGS